ncbi:MAG: TolC family protein [Desulfuromonadales bacterium]|nr:TolC family protein [Desulfuromonadales bacterium]
MHFHVKKTGIIPRWQIAAVLTALLLCACTPVVQSTQPEGVLPAHFSASGAVQSPERWWTTFADPRLNQLIDLALTENPGLRATWERLQQAAAVARKAGAERSPTLTLEGGGSRTRSLPDGSATDTTSYTVGLNAAYELDLWGRVAATRAAAELDFQASAADLQTAALTLSTQVASTWYQLLEKQGQLELLQAQSDANQQIEELVLVRVRTGKTGVADLLQQQQLIAALRGEGELVSAEIERLGHRLAILCGQPPTLFPLSTAAEFPPLPPRPATGLPLEMIQRRPDLRAALAAVQAADQRVAAAIADRFPRLSLSARISSSEASISALFDNWLTTLAANLVGPLVDGGRRRAEVERTAALAKGALHNYRQAALTALGEVEDALSTEDRRQQYLVSLDRQLHYATSVLNNLRDRYLRGATDYQRVLGALLDQQRLERTQLQAQRDLLLNRITLYSALSGGWPSAVVAHTSER